MSLNKIENRELKFRCWNGSEMLEDVGLIPNKKGIMTSIGSDGIYVNPRSQTRVLLQFTGLKDKNGSEVYEGDVYHMGDPSILYVVEWQGAGLKGRQISNRSTAGLEYWQDRIEVIGNIYSLGFRHSQKSGF